MAQQSQPAWVERMFGFYEAGIAHAFVFHFNVNDYSSASQPVMPVTYLSQILSGREVVAMYSRDQGITFPLEAMRAKALELLGLTKPEPAPVNPALAALQSVGAAPQSGDVALPRSPSEALPILDKLLRMNSGNKTAVIIEGAELICPDAPLAQMSPEDRVALGIMSRWGRDPAIVNAGNPVFLTVRNVADLHQGLRAASSRYESIEVPLPNTQARSDFIQQYLARTGFELEPAAIQQMANATAGLSLLHVEDILLRAERSGGLTSQLVWERKKDIIRTEFGDVLEVIEPRFGFADIGGLAHVKNFFKRSVIRPMHDGRKARVPMGVLMTGPAGTGKSIMAEAVAKEAGVNAVNLRIGGQIASKWQGEGERNLDRALRAVAGLAPCIVFIDEIDQSINRGEGGNQQDQRIFQRLLEFMSDTAHRGEVVFLAATNRPDLMDAALRRPGRFDKKIPFLVPDADERKTILVVMARRYLGEVIEAAKLGDIAAKTEGWTGAELEALAVKAYELADDYLAESGAAMNPVAALAEAVGKLTPSTADIEFMTMLAVRECNDRDLLPPRYQQMLEDRAALDEQIEKAQPQQLNRRKRQL